jgi:hypothetical protein
VSRTRVHLGFVVGTSILVFAMLASVRDSASPQAAVSGPNNSARNAAIQNAINKVEDGEQIFRFDTFGDQAFWGDTLNLHKAIEGAAQKLGAAPGGIGPGVSPKAALVLGLKVDLDALPKSLVEQIEKGTVNLNDPAVTLVLLKLKAVVGVTGACSIPREQCNLWEFSARCVIPRSITPLLLCVRGKLRRIPAPAV